MTSIIALTSIFTVLLGVIQFMYRMVDVDGNTRISYKTYKKLRAIAPEKWESAPGYGAGIFDNFVWYTKPNGYSERIYMNTFVESLLLMMERDEDNLSDLRESWLKDIEEYQKKSTKEIDVCEQAAKKDLEHIKDSVHSMEELYRYPYKVKYGDYVVDFETKAVYRVSPTGGLEACTSVSTAAQGE